MVSGTQLAGLSCSISQIVQKKTNERCEFFLFYFFFIKLTHKKGHLLVVETL